MKKQGFLSDNTEGEGSNRIRYIYLTEAGKN